MTIQACVAGLKDWVLNTEGSAASIGAVLLLVSAAAFPLYLWWRKDEFIANLSRRYILVTGCDSGFGNDLVKYLDNLGCGVIAGCLTDDGLEKLNIATSRRCTAIKLDVTKPESLAAAKDHVEKLLPENTGLWGIVNNAGVSTIGLTRWLTKKDYELCMNVNMYGTIDVTTTFLQLVRKEGGRVVNMSSMLGLFPMPGNSPYCISKCAVEAFSDVLRRETKEIKVCIIEPGVFKTPITTPEAIERGVLTAWEKAPPEVKEKDRVLAAKAAELARKSMAAASDKTHLVVDAYIHALLSKNPRRRYLVGSGAKFAFCLSVLPAGLADWAFDWMKQL